MRHFSLISAVVAFALALAAVAPAHARDFEMGGDNSYPNSIMAPEPGTVSDHRRGAAPVKTPQGRMKSLGKGYAPGNFLTVRGSPGSVLPTPLPKTLLIPPEGGGMPTVRAAPQQQGPTFVPGLTNPVPNLPHGSNETFQDRASRCAFQAGLNGVPNTASAVYMHTCAM